MRRFVRSLLVPACIFALTLPLSAALLSKSYQFKPGVSLELGVPADGGLRLDSVEFTMPAPGGRRFLKFGGNVVAEVAVSNGGSEPRKIGLAIALFDKEGRLVGVASGGSKLIAIKPERQSVYSLVFDDLNRSASRAVSFQISLEPK